jgi:hypothetical protein
VESEETSIARQRLGNYVPMATNTQATIEELLGTTFSVLSLQSGHKLEFSLEPPVEYRSSK